jgi:hypothetical protein
LTFEQVSRPGLRFIDERTPPTGGGIRFTDATSNACGDCGCHRRFGALQEDLQSLAAVSELAPDFIADESQVNLDCTRLEGDMVAIDNAVVERDDLFFLAWPASPAQLASILLEDEEKRRTRPLAGNIGCTECEAVKHQTH